MSKKKTLEEFIAEATEKHDGKYDYSLITQEIWNTVNVRYSKVPIICPIHGIFYQTVSNHLNKGNNGKYHGCPTCANENLVQPNNPRNTNKKHYGRKTTEQFISEAKLIHGDKYDYSEVNYINAKTKVKIFCKECNKYFMQTPDSHINKKSGCIYCGDKLKSLVQIYSLEEINELVQESNPDLEVLEYNGYSIDALMRCKKCGTIFYRSPANQIKQRENCPNCKSSMPIGEKTIKTWLEKNNISFIHDTDCLEWLSPKRPDFYLPELNIVIEYDGEQHFVEIETWEKKCPLSQRQENDRIKNKLCIEHNIPIIRIPYWKLKNIPDIMEDIMYKYNSGILENFTFYGLDSKPENCTIAFT